VNKYHDGDEMSDFGQPLGKKTRTIEGHYILDNKAIKLLELYLLIRIFDMDHKLQI
jgi:hypothetical protein